MSIRIIGCYLYVLAFGWYARRNWFISACAAITLMAVIQHPDMPKNVLDIQGFNPWNLLFGPVLICWWLTRRQRGWPWEMPGHVMLLILAYAAVVLFSISRLLMNPSGWGGESFSYMLSEYVINCAKWILPGLLFFDGTRSRRQAFFAIAAILCLYFLLAVQVIRWVPLGAGAGKAARYIQNEIGYNRVTLSMMLSGASFAVLTTVVLFSKWKHKLPILIAAGAVAWAQAITGGRSGYASWLAVGFCICLARWRKWLLVFPVVLAVLLAVVPGLRERVLQGFGTDSGPIVVADDKYEMTSGRNIAWPAVIRQIEKGPVIGFGREAMSTTGVQQFLMDEFFESFPHPHQAYLEVLLDMGIVGLCLVMPFYLFVLYQSFRLLRDRDDPLVVAVGGICCCLVLALMTAAFGGQTFYPREGAVGMWAAIGLMLRFYVERARQPHGLLFTEEEETDQIVEAEIVDDGRTPRWS